MTVYTDRLAVSFVVYVVSVSFGLFQPTEAFLLTSIGLWISAFFLLFR